MIPPHQEAHGHQRHATDEVRRAHHHLLRPVRVKAGAGHIVAEADGRQRDEAEVGGDERLPAGARDDAGASERSDLEWGQGGDERLPVLG